MKVKITIIIFSCLAIIGFIGTFWGSAVARAATGIWDSCQRGMVDCSYPGQCRSYIDTNDDGICDRSQPEPEQDSTPDTTDIIITDITSPVTETADEIAEIPEITPEVIEQDSFSGDDIEGSPLTVVDKAGKKRSYHFIAILLGTALLYGITWLLSRMKVIRQLLHRRIWNIVLLVSTIISALLGLFLILNLDFNLGISLPFNMLYWHVETGIAMGVIAVFHILWHWKYFTKMVKANC